jgi:nitrite reductase (NADH) small subunit
VKELLSGGESGGRPPTAWVPVCPVADLVADRPVCAKVGDNQVAVVLTAGDGKLYAIDNHDPFSGANVLSRGIVGSVGEKVVLASPMFKQHFELVTGRCVEDPAVVLDIFEVRQSAGWVEVADAPLS